MTYAQDFVLGPGRAQHTQASAGGPRNAESDYGLRAQALTCGGSWAAGVAR